MKKRKGVAFMDYSDVVETAFLTGPKALQKHAGFVK